MTRDEAATSITPVRDALVRRARADAERLRAEAGADAARTEADARQEAEHILAEARARGEADAAAVRAAELVRARRTARTIVLGARRAGYQKLRRNVEAELARRYADPALRAALVARVRHVLGDGALVVDAPGGGVLGRHDGRRVDYSLAALTARAVEALDDTVEQLWM